MMFVTLFTSLVLNERAKMNKKNKIKHILEKKLLLYQNELLKVKTYMK